MTDGLGNAVRMYRNKLGLKQNVLAERCGVTPTYLSMIEKGKKWPSYELIEKLCLHLGVRQSDLYKDLFIDSITREDQSAEQREIATLLRIVYEKITALEQKNTYAAA